MQAATNTESINAMDIMEFLLHYFLVHLHPISLY